MLEEEKIKHQPVYCHAVPNKCTRGGWPQYCWHAAAQIISATLKCVTKTFSTYSEELYCTLTQRFSWKLSCQDDKHMIPFLIFNPSSHYLWWASLPIRYLYYSAHDWWERSISGLFRDQCLRQVNKSRVKRMWPVVCVAQVNLVPLKVIILLRQTKT